MSLHKARPGSRPDPTQPYCTVMANGRAARPHAQVDGKPILGGIQNAIVTGQGRTPEEEKDKIHEYHANREEVKKANKAFFEDKTGRPKTQEKLFGPNPNHDAQSVAPENGPAGQASEEEKKKNIEAEKKTEEKEKDKDKK